MMNTRCDHAAIAPGNHLRDSYLLCLLHVRKSLRTHVCENFLRATRCDVVSHPSPDDGSAQPLQRCQIANPQIVIPVHLDDLAAA
jgi:hypothetical protein